MDDRETVILDSIAEAQLTDKGSKRRREERDMDVLADLLLRHKAVEQDTEEGRPHIEEVKTVEAMRHNEHIAREDGRVRLGTTDINDKVG